MSRTIDIIVGNKHGICLRLIDQQVAVVFLVIIRVATSEFLPTRFQWTLQPGDKGVLMAGCERSRSTMLKRDDIRARYTERRFMNAMRYLCLTSDGVIGIACVSLNRVMAIFTVGIWESIEHFMFVGRVARGNENNDE